MRQCISDAYLQEKSHKCMPYHNTKKRIIPTPIVVDKGGASILYPYMLHDMISFKF